LVLSSRAENNRMRDMLKPLGMRQRWEQRRQQAQRGRSAVRERPSPQDRSPLVAGWQADSRSVAEPAVLPVAAHIRCATAEVQRRR